MDKELMNRINEAMKADDMGALSLEDLDDVSGGSEFSKRMDDLGQAFKEVDDFSKKMCNKYGMSTVKKAILTNQLSREEQAKWIELNEKSESLWQNAKEYLLSLN